MAKWYLLMVMTLMNIQNSFCQESNSFVRKIFGSIARELFDYTCRDATPCQLDPAESFGCHLYSAARNPGSEGCLVKTYTEFIPTVYIKPDKDFEYLEVHMYNRFCVPPIFEYGKWVLSKERFPESGTWYEVKMRLLEHAKIYQLLINGQVVAREKAYYTPLNNTHFQFMTKGSALWSFDCNPEQYSAVRFSSVPWIILCILVFILIVIALGIIIYCTRKLSARASGFSGRKTLQHSSRSTISLISGPALHQQSHDFRSSRSYQNSSVHCSQLSPSASSTCLNLQWSRNPAGRGNAVSERWSNATSVDFNQRSKKWSSTPAVHAGHGFKKWSYIAGDNPHSGIPVARPPSEHIYEEVDEHIYHEIDEAGVPVYTNKTEFNADCKPEFQGGCRPSFPLARGVSVESSFSTVNSLYGYR